MKIIPEDSTIRVLPAVVFDTLEFAALAFGGIGEMQDFEDRNANDMGSANDDWNCPLCVHGLALAAVSRAKRPTERENNPITKALAVVGIGRLANDEAVEEIIRQRGFELVDDTFTRVSWDDYRTYFNLVRGD